MKRNRSRSKIHICLGICLLGGLLSVWGQKPVIQSEQALYVVDTLVTGLKIPWSLTFPAENQLLITERPGTLKLYDMVSQSTQEIKGLPDIFAHGQGGLLDVELHPNYAENGWIYLSHAYSDGKKEGNTTLMRAKINNGKLVDQEVLFKGTPLRRSGNHFGGRIEFDKAGYLYFSIGDRGARENAQKPENILGTVMRFHDDGRIPDDNPFVGKAGKRPEIYSYGHRNPQGLTLNPSTGEIWEHEHGPRGGDEINIIRKGLNYGWPAITYGINYSGTEITPYTEKPGMEQPVRYYVPSIAPCGMDFYSGDQFPEWKGDLFVGSLKFMYLERLEVKGNEVVGSEKLLEKMGRVRTVREGPDGYLYVVLGTPGMVVRLRPA